MWSVLSQTACPDARGRQGRLGGPGQPRRLGATGFGYEETAGLMWWSSTARTLEFSTVTGAHWAASPPLRTFLEVGTPSGVSAVGMQSWDLVTSTSEGFSRRRRKFTRVWLLWRG